MKTARSFRSEEPAEIDSVRHVSPAETMSSGSMIPFADSPCLSKPGRVPLEIIEVQSGAYLGEDDIVRFEDHYGRIER